MTAQVKLRRELRKIAEHFDPDFTERVTKKGHFMIGFRNQDRTGWITIAGSPSSPRCMVAARTDMQRVATSLGLVKL